MNTFSFVIHPLELRRDAARKYPILGLLPEVAIEQISLRLSPKYLSRITGIESKLGTQCEGHFIGCPLSPHQLLNLPPEMVYKRLVECGKLSAEKGAKIMGLGALTSVAGDAGVTVARELEGTIAVTTGNSYTVYTAIEGLIKAAGLMEIEVATARLAIVGANGSIGAVCAKILAKDVAAISLIGRDEGKLRALKSEVEALPGSVAEITTATDISRALREADLILAVSSAGSELIFPDDLKSGSVVCDVARPRDVSKTVVEKRDDVLVIEGGVIEIPGNVNFNFNFGFPDKTAYACMSETMLLTLEGKFVNYTLGRELTVEQVTGIGELAAKHGFKLAGFRAFETSVTQETINRVRANVRARRKGSASLNGHANGMTVKAAVSSIT